MLAGHKIGLQGIYFKPRPIDLLEGNDKMLGYASIINSLTINDENRLRLEVNRLSVNNKKKDNDYVIRRKLEEKRINSMEEQLHSLISIIGTMDESSKNKLAMKMFEKGMYKMTK